MAILLVLLVVGLALAKPEALAEWFTGFDPKTWPGFVLVAIAALSSEYGVLRLRAGVKSIWGFLRWWGLNALLAALWSLPVAALLYSGLLDSTRFTLIAVVAVLYELILVSLTTGWLWSRPRGGKVSRGFGIFISMNLTSIAVSVLTGYAWHHLYDWLEMKGVVRAVLEKTRFLRD